MGSEMCIRDRFPICISKSMKFAAWSSVKNAIFISMNFEMMDRVFTLLKMAFFTELQAANFIDFDIHMGNLPKNDQFLFLKNCR